MRYPSFKDTERNRKKQVYMKQLLEIVEASGGDTNKINWNSPLFLFNQGTDVFSAARGVLEEQRAEGIIKSFTWKYGI